MEWGKSKPLATFGGGWQRRGGNLQTIALDIFLANLGQQKHKHGLILIIYILGI
jgi:hypothetical protein